MKAIGYYNPLPIDDAASLQDLELPAPTPGARDLLVRVKAISVNPVDTKVRKSAPPAAGKAKVLGWDAVGIVEAIGDEVRSFKVGDRVYYAGSIVRAGANSELHAVDERIVALAPTSLDDAQAAALPLTTITAYELLFDRLGVAKGGGAGQTLLIVGGAGGVGSILIQLARQLTQLKVVATASRAETRQWCLDLGAHEVIDHSKPLAAELREAGLGEVEFVASLTQTPQHFAQIIESLKPQGAIAVIDDMPTLDVTPSRPRACRCTGRPCSCARASRRPTWPSRAGCWPKWRRWSMPARCAPRPTPASAPSTRPTSGRRMRSSRAARRAAR